MRDHHRRLERQRDETQRWKADESKTTRGNVQGHDALSSKTVPDLIYKIYVDTCQFKRQSLLARPKRFLRQSNEQKSHHVWA